MTRIISLSVGRAVLVALLWVVAATPGIQAQQNGTITGTVTDAVSQRPLSGVQISIPGTGIGTLSGANGRYLLLNVPPGEVTVRAEMIGYGQAQATTTVTPGETSSLNMTLTEQAITLSEIVVTGSAVATEKRKLGNTISTVNANQVMNSAPVSSVDQLLQGRSAGVSVDFSSGTVGTGGMIRVRGMTSVSLSGDPVIYIDGTRVDGSADQNGVWFGGQDISRLQDLSPSEIDRIEIVKGAAASTLYGTQGANGVIQIFTKRGRMGSPEWTLEVESGFERTPTDTFPGMRNTEFVGPTGFRAHDPRELVGNGLHQRYSASVSGGVESVKYYINGSFRSQEASIAPYANWQKVFAARANVTAMLHPTVTATVTSSFVQNRLRVPDDNNALHGLYSQFASGLPYTATEERPFGERFGSFDANATLENHQTVLRNTTGLDLSHQPNDTFRENLHAGIDWYDDEFTKYFPFGYEGSGNKLGNKRNHTRTFRDVTLEYRASLNSRFGGIFNSDLTLGTQGNFSKTVRVNAYGENFPAPGVKSVSAASVTNGDESRIEEINAGVFVQEVLGIWDKLFLTGGLRLDGNSAFGNEFQSQLYPKASVAYNISEEDFWPTRLIPTMKLRVAYGESGNAPAQFAADRTWSPISAQDGQPAVTPGNIGNPELGPERSQEIEVGFDAGLWDDRIGLEVTGYFQKTLDALLYKPYPASQGFTSSQLTNIGEIQNRGIEIGVNALLVQEQDWSWSSNVQFSAQHNEVTDMGGVPDISGFGYRVTEGYPVHGAWGYDIDRWDPELRRHFVTDSMTFKGQTDPKWFGSASTHLRWKDLSFSTTAEFAGGHVKDNFSKYWSNRVRTGDEYLSLVEKPRGEPTPAADSLYDYSARLGSSGFYEPNDYLILREASVSYDLPEDFISRFGMERASIRLSGRNLAILYKQFSGIHPETNWDGQANLRQGQDFDTLPPARIFLLTFRMVM
jgi:TonB-dependent SusC/RagA subfamily outer membrane receptor